VTAYQDRCRGWLDWLVRRQDLRFIDFATLYRDRAAKRRDLAALRTECGLEPGAEGELPLYRSGPEEYMPSSAFDKMTYQWLPYPPDFTGEKLIEQASLLAWTAAPAHKKGVAESSHEL
jgi:hypothetical protein